MELLHCPFCRSNELNKTEHRSYEEVWCECGASNSSDNWNTRIPSWISVKDRLPEKSDLYLTYSKKSGLVRTKRFYAINIYSKDTSEHRLRFLNSRGHEDTNITHWMPLPLLPENKS